MAEFVSPEEFAEIDRLAEQLLEEARKLGVGRTPFPGDATPEQRALHQETMALALAVMGLAHITPLEPGAVMVGAGHAIATVVAQAMENHAELYRLLRTQMKQSYDDVRRSSMPPTGAVN